MLEDLKLLYEAFRGVRDELATMNEVVASFNLPEEKRSEVAQIVDKIMKYQRAIEHSEVVQIVEIEKLRNRTDGKG